MRTALAVEQGRIFLVGVKFRRINHPHEHLLAVGGLHPAFLRLAHINLVEILLVGESELGLGTLVGWVNGVDFSRLLMGGLGGDELTISPCKTVVIVVAISENLNLCDGFLFLL